MAYTYADKIRKYRAKVEESQRVGIEPRSKDVARLLYYVGRAEEKGPDHEVGFKDKAKSTAMAQKGNLGTLLKRAAELLK